MSKEWIAGTRTTDGYHGIVMRRSDMKQDEAIVSVWDRNAPTLYVLDALEQLVHKMRQQYFKETNLDQDHA